MPAQAALTIADGAATPANFTFNPNGVVAQPNQTVVGSWLNKSAGYTVGNIEIVHQYKPRNASGIQRQRFLIRRPSLEVLAGGATNTGFEPKPTVAYENTAVLEFWTHERSTFREKEDIWAFAKNLAASVYTYTAVSGSERPW
jgi:hypothetical protein